MKTFYLVRHGESKANAQRLLAGWHDTSLSERGRSQAEDMAERLAFYPVEVAHTSDLKRAAETAAFFEHRSGIRAAKNPALREIHMGKWEGVAFDDLPQEDEVVQKWLSQDIDFVYPGGESVEDVVNRMVKCFRWLMSLPQNHIAVFGHGMSLSILIAELVFKNYRLSYGLHLENGGITLLHCDGDYFYLSKLNG